MRTTVSIGSKENTRFATMKVYGGLHPEAAYDRLYFEKASFFVVKHC